MAQVIYVHVPFGAPLGSGYMTQSGTYQHQGTLPVRKSADGPSTPLDLAVQPLDGVVWSDPGPVLGNIRGYEEKSVIRILL